MKVLQNQENLTDDVTTCRKVQGQCLDTPITASLRHDNARTEKPGYLDLSHTECLISSSTNDPLPSNLKPTKYGIKDDANIPPCVETSCEKSENQTECLKVVNDPSFPNLEPKY